MRGCCKNMGARTGKQDLRQRRQRSNGRRQLGQGVVDQVQVHQVLPPISYVG